MDNRRTTYDGQLTKRRDPLEVRADGEQGILTGYASKYWVVDSYAEATAPGAFAETISQRGPRGSNRILLRYEHETTIGTHRSMAEDAAGLVIEGHVSDDGMDGTRVRRHLADGVQYGISIGFRRMADRTAEESDPLDLSTAPSWVQSLPRNEIRILTGVKLYENSVVSFPAVDPALVESYRSDAPDIDALIAAVQSGRLSDDHLTQLKALFTSPADPPGTDGETLADVRLLQTVRRQRNAELIALHMKLHGLGALL